MPAAVRQTVVTAAFATLCALVATLAVVAATKPVVLNTPIRTVATDPSGTYNPGLVTSGDGTVSKRPDISFISVGAEAQAGSAGDAQRNLAAIMNKLVAKAKSLGIPDSEINTSGYSVGPMYSPDGKGTITGYQAGEQLDLKWHNVSTVGNALDGLVQQGGATRISVSFGLNDPKAAQAEARSLAIADAKTRAAAMAKAAGVSLGQVLRITDSTQVYRPPQYNFAPSAAAIDQTQLPVGSMDIQVSVEMSFAIA